MNTENQSIRYWELIDQDPELAARFPVKPRLARNVKMFPYGKGLTIVGGSAIESFEGNGVRAKASRIFPMMDGTRSLEALLTDTDGVSREERQEFLAKLYLSGLLRDGPVNGVPGVIEEYFERTCGVTGKTRSGAESVERLEESRIALYTDARVFDVLKGSTFTKLPILFTNEKSFPKDADFLVVVSSGESDPGDLFAQASAHGVAALNVEVTNHAMRLGPLILPQRTASYACYRHLYDPLAGDCGEHQLYFGVSLAMHYVSTLIGGSNRQASFNSFTEYRWVNGRQIRRQKPVARLHHWDQSGNPVPFPIDRETPGFALWERYCGIALQSYDYMPPNAYQHHYKASNIRAIFERNPALYTGKKRPLPAANAELASARDSDTLELADIAQLIRFTAGYGVRNGIPQRLTPTGGNLGSTQLVVVAFDVGGLEPGFYWYDAQADTLEELHEEGLEELRAGHEALKNLPAAILCLSNTPKVSRKYGPFSYNISWYDAGVLRAHLESLCDVLGLDCLDVSVDHGDDVLKLLKIEKSGFLLTGVYGVQARADSQSQRNHHGITVRELPSLIARRQAVREWARLDVDEGILEPLCALAHCSVREFARTADFDLNLSILFLLKRGDGEDGFYQLDDNGQLNLVTGFHRDRHERILSQRLLGQAPIIALPKVDLLSGLEDHGQLLIARAYRACGSIVGDLWLHAAAAGLVGTACGGCFEGEVRSALRVHDLSQFAPLALCLGPGEIEAPTALQRPEAD